MKRKTFTLLPILFFMIVCFGGISFGQELSGPDTIEVMSGQPVSVTYSLPAGYASTKLSVSNVSSGLAVYYDMVHYYSSVLSQTHAVYVVGGKPGTYSFQLSLAGVDLPAKNISVIVKEGTSLCLDGSIYDYDTKRNTFIVYIGNYSAKPISIISGKAKATSYSYKSFNRTLRVKKSVTIQPGEEKYIKFKVRGRTTWYDPTDFSIQCKCKYNKKKYNLRICDSEYEQQQNGVITGRTNAGYAEVKINGSWINTMLCVPWYQ